jgi:putative peptidoglycan lipid II flippase
LLRSSATVAVGSLLSRITGLVRVYATGRAIGTASWLAGAYNAANNVPNIIYELAVGGVLSASLVPLFVERIESEDREGTSVLVSVAIVSLGTLAVAGVLAAPALGWFLGLGVHGPGTEGYREVLVRLLRWFMPQVYFYGLITVTSALLQARRRFAAAAFAPAVNNLVASAALLALPSVVRGDLRGADPLGLALAEPRVLLWLGLGTTLGVAASALVVLPVLGDRTFALRFRPHWRHPLVSRLVRLSGWTVGYVAANQVTSVVTILAANRAPKGAIAAYDYAYIFFVVPHGLLAVSFMTALTPELARSVQRGDRRGLRREWTNGLRLTALLMLPASAGLFVLAQPFVALLFSGRQDVLLTTGVLRAFAVGLAGFSVYLYALRVFYAEGNIRMPFRLNLVENAVQIVFTVVLGLVMGAAGLALAHSIAYLLAAVLAFAAAAHRLGRLPVSTLSTLPAMIFSTIAMGVVVAAGLTVLRWGVNAAGYGFPPLLEIAAGVAIGVPAYVLYLRGFGAGSELAPLVARLRRLLPGRLG